MTECGDSVRLDFHDDGVAVITLAQPARLNVVGLAVRDELIEALTATRANQDVRALLLRAEGRHFSAGANLREFGSAESIFEARRIRWDRDPWYLMGTVPQPSVVALHGYALGSGLEMALLCDFRVGSPDTVVGLPETKLGMLPAAGGTRSISTVVRPTAALPLVLDGEPVDSLTALRLGLLHTVVDDVEDTARRLASRLARLPSGAAQAAKRALRASTDLPLPQGLQHEKHLARLVQGS